LLSNWVKVLRIKNIKGLIMKTSNILLSLVAVSALTLTGCGGGGSSSGGNGGGAGDPTACTTYTTPSTTTLSGDITSCTELTKDKTWVLDGLVVVKGTTLKIEAGTTIVGKDEQVTLLLI